MDTAKVLQEKFKKKKLRRHLCITEATMLNLSGVVQPGDVASFEMIFSFQLIRAVRWLLA